MLSFGSRLKEARKARKLTQAEVANIIGIDFTTISKYENDRSEPDNDTLQKLSSLYSVSTDWLIKGHEAGSGNVVIEEEHPKLPTVANIAAHMEEEYGVYDPDLAKEIQEAIVRKRERYWAKYGK